VHAADGDRLLLELDDGVGVAGTQDVLAESAPRGGGTGLAAFDFLLGLVSWCGGDAVLVSGIVSRIVAFPNLPLSYL
jgi:hypothetical protein